MLGKFKLTSLTSKLFLLLFIVLASLALPFSAVVYYNVLGLTSNFEEDSFSNTLLLVEENLRSNYLNMLSNQTSKMIEKKSYLRLTALLAKNTWRMLDHLDAEKKQELFSDWLVSLTDVDNRIALFKDGLPLEQVSFYNILKLTDKGSALKGQKLTSVLNSANLPTEGSFLLFTLDRENLIKFSTDEVRISPELYQISKDLLKEGKEVPILVYSLPVDNNHVIVVASLLSDVRYESVQQLDLVVHSMQEKFSSLAFYPKSILALISGNGKLIAQKGKITQDDIEFLPKELFEKARKDKYVSLHFDADLASSDNQFLKDFGSTIFRLNYFKSLDWYILAAVPQDVIRANSNQLLKKLIIVAFVIIVFCIILTFFMAYKFTVPIRKLTQKVKELSNINLLHQLEAKPNAKSFSDICQDLPVNRGDEVGELAKSFNVLGTALDENIANLLESRAISERFKGEIDAAKEIQMSILPNLSHIPIVDNYSVGAFLEPAKEIGGDLYDFFELEDGRKVFVIGDVSGKGVAAALFMSITVTLVRDAINDGLMPHDAMSRINKTLSKNNTSCMFVTLIIAIFDPATKRLDYANAGHCYPIIVNDHGAHELKMISGPMVGPLENITYKLCTTKLDANSLCFLYTDGISEAMNEQNNLYGEERLLALLMSEYNKEGNELINKVHSDVIEFRQNAEQSDDITMLCFKCR